MSITDRQASTAAPPTPAQLKHTVSDLCSALSPALQTLQDYFQSSPQAQNGRPHA